MFATSPGACTVQWAFVLMLHFGTLWPNYKSGHFLALPSAIIALVIHWAVNCGCVCYLGLVVWMLVVAGSGVRSCNFVYSGTDKLEWTLNVPGFVSRMHTRVYMGNETSQPFIPHSNPILPPMWMWLSRMHQKYSITCNIIRCVTLCCVQHRELVVVVIIKLHETAWQTWRQTDSQWSA